MLRLVLLGTCFCAFSNGQWTVPDAQVEVFSPRGFQVSIPDEDGIELFAFHGKINEEMDGREAGTFSKDILKAKNGRWTYQNKDVKLKVGDTLHFWTYVIRSDKAGYPRDDQKFTVTRLIETGTGTTTTTSTTTTTTESPNVVIPDMPNCDEYSSTIFNDKTACKGHVVFQNTFDSFPYEYWTPEIKFPGPPDYEFVVYTNITVKIKAGKLSIRPVPIEDVYGKGSLNRPLDLEDRCTGKSGSDECVVKPEAGFILPPIVSTQITTKNSFKFRYGRVEVRAKLPKGDWIYPELFLMPASEDYGPGYQSGQIRIAFTHGNVGYDKTLHGGVVLGGSKSARKYGLKEVHQLDSWCDDFHTFTVLWKPDSIALYVDGSAYGTVRPPTGGFSSLGPELGINTQSWSHSSMAPFDKDMYLSIGVGVGGFNFADDVYPNKPWRNGERLSFKKFYNATGEWSQTWGEHSSLDIDYVKVWAV